jgi:hypothetical protein
VGTDDISQLPGLGTGLTEVGWGGGGRGQVNTRNVKPMFFKDRLLSFSHYRPPKKSNIFVFETKFVIEPKRSL